MTTTPAPAPSWFRQMIGRLGREVAYLLTAFPLALAAWVVLVTLGSVALGTLVIWVGVGIGVVTLWAMRAFAGLERARLRLLGGRGLEAAYRSADRRFSLRSMLGAYGDTQMWRDAAHAFLAFPLSVVTWSLALTWTAAAVGGPTEWFWGRWLPTDDAEPITGFLGWLNSSPGQATAGLVALVTLPWVAHVLALPHRLLGEWLLDATPNGALRQKVSRLEEQGKAAARAESEALRRIERDLHDGPQQRLIRMQMELSAAERSLGKNAKARSAIADAQRLSAEALAELRALTRGIAPPILAERGLAAAIESLAERSTVPVAVACDVPGSLAIGVETTAYFVVSESLANVAKHAGASAASVGVRRAGDVLTITVSDDGRGGAHVAKGHGLAGLEERVAGAGGNLAVGDGPDGGTVVTAEVPCASS